MPCTHQDKTTKHIPTKVPPSPEECRVKLSIEAQRLRVVAMSIRDWAAKPEFKEYLKSERGLMYLGDYDNWVKQTHVAFAFEQAAEHLDSAFRLLGGVINF